MSWKQTVNKPAGKPAASKPKFDTKDDDWDTDLSYENSVTEKSQRYGSASIPGSGRVDHVDFNSMQEKMKTVDQKVKEDFKEKNPTRGYGGRYGTEQVMDKAAEGYSYKADVTKHSSQTDGKKGFGGAHGIDERAKDQSAVGFDYKPTVEKHSSQTDYTAGFGGAKEVQKEEPKKAPAKPVAATPPPPPPKPSAEPKVAEKPAPSTPVKADVGNIRARFENMKKEQEAEAAKRVAEERKKRATTDQKLQQQETVKKTTRVPSTEETSETVDNTDTEPVVSTSSRDENDDNYTEEKTDVPATNEKTNQQSDQFAGTVNVTSILRQRKPSSTSSKNDDDDEWADK